MKEVRDPETYAILGAAMAVHRELGHGFLEIVYQTAMALEFAERGIAFQAEVPLPIRYKGKLLTCSYRADFICFEAVLVETKAISQLSGADRAQVINALTATGLRRGLLVNFGATSLQYERLAFDPTASSNLRKSAKSADEIFL
ncbi:MAG: GxxExxY protein [Chthoniobacterales bacterium]|nr:GxxExxY protein [Chthoniobacterales bacterium]